jgi:heat shock protein HslJ
VRAQALDLPSGEWRLSELNGRRVVDSKAHIVIDVNAARISGNAGCNRMFGTVAGGKGKIVFSKIGSTKMFCADAAANRIENEFLAALSRVTRYHEDETTLSLVARGRVVAKLSAVRKMPPQEPPATTLEGVKWMIDTVAGKKVTGPAAAAFIRFDAEKKRSGGDTGCNAFGGTYSVKGDKIAVTDVISTMRACIEDDRMTIERQFLDALRDANRFAIADGKLTLFRGPKPLITFRPGS